MNNKLILGLIVIVFISGCNSVDLNKIGQEDKRIKVNEETNLESLNILFFGDSICAKEFNINHTNIPDELEKLNKEFNVVNFCIRDYNLKEYSEFISIFPIDIYKPDIIILLMNPNDFNSISNKQAIKIIKDKNIKIYILRYKNNADINTIVDKYKIKPIILSELTELEESKLYQDNLHLNNVGKRIVAKGIYEELLK